MYKSVRPYHQNQRRGRSYCQKLTFCSTLRVLLLYVLNMSLLRLLRGSNPWLDPIQIQLYLILLQSLPHRLET